MKPITFTIHAGGQLIERGVTAEEVEDAIQTSAWGPAKYGRMECIKNFDFNSYWKERYYATKRVHPIFVEEASEIVVVTVIGYYF